MKKHMKNIFFDYVNILIGFIAGLIVTGYFPNIEGMHTRYPLVFVAGVVDLFLFTVFLELLVAFAFKKRNKNADSNERPYKFKESPKR